MGDIVISISAITGISGMICALIALFRNKKKDDLADGQNVGSLHTDIGYIKKGIDGIESRLEKQESQYINVVTQLTSVSESAKQAHKRIDKLEKYHTPNWEEK
jgi:hypothetical protein